jgi:hypothetical protein
VTGLTAVFLSKTRGLGGDFGVAILSRYPALETSRIRLAGWQRHGSSWCVLGLRCTALQYRVASS